MNTFLLVFEVIVAVALILLVLIQSGDAGLTGIWSGGGETYHSKRGVEKIVFIATIVCAALFTLLAVLILLTSTAQAPALDESLTEDLSQIDLNSATDSAESTSLSADLASDSSLVLEELE